MLTALATIVEERAHDLSRVQLREDFAASQLAVQFRGVATLT